VGEILVGNDVTDQNHLDPDLGEGATALEADRGPDPGGEVVARDHGPVAADLGAAPETDVVGEAAADREREVVAEADAVVGLLAATKRSLGA